MERTDLPGQVDRLVILPIVKDNYVSEQFVRPPDRVIGYRFYVQNMGVKSIIEVRSDDTSDYNLVNWYNVNWDEDDVTRNEVDSRDRL